MPVYLSVKETRTNISRRDKAPSVLQDFVQPAISGSETGRRAEPVRSLRLQCALDPDPHYQRHRRNSSSNRQRNHVLGSLDPQRLENGIMDISVFNSKPKVVSELPAPASKPLETRSEGALATPADLPTSNPVESAKHKHVTPQFASIHGAQGPSSPHTSEMLHKARVLSNAETNRVTSAVAAISSNSNDCALSSSTTLRQTTSRSRPHNCEPSVRTNPDTTTAQSPTTTQMQLMTSQSTTNCSADPSYHAQIAPHTAHQGSSKSVLIEPRSGTTLVGSISSASTDAALPSVSASKKRQLSVTAQNDPSPPPAPHSEWPSQHAFLPAPLVLEEPQSGPHRLTSVGVNMAHRDTLSLDVHPGPPAIPQTGSSHDVAHGVSSPRGISESRLVAPPLRRSQRTAVLVHEASGERQERPAHVHRPETQSQDPVILPLDTSLANISSQPSLPSAVNQVSTKQSKTKKKKVSFARGLVDDPPLEQVPVLPGVNGWSAEPTQAGLATQIAPVVLDVASTRSTEQMRVEEMRSIPLEHVALSEMLVREPNRTPQSASSVAAPKPTQAMEPLHALTLKPQPTSLQDQPKTSQILSDVSTADPPMSFSQTESASAKLDELRSPRPPAGTLRVYELGLVQEPIHVHLETSAPTTSTMRGHLYSHSYNVDINTHHKHPSDSNGGPQWNELQSLKSEPLAHSKVDFQSSNKANVGHQGLHPVNASAVNTKEHATPKDVSVFFFFQTVRVAMTFIKERCSKCNSERTGGY
jgi:hypothetical protein